MFQYYNAVLHKKSSLRIVPRNITFTILIRIKAAAWPFNQLDYCVLPREAVYWSSTVPREIP